MSNQIPPTVHIVANGLPEAYYKAVKECIKNGALIKREYGKPVNTKDMISLIEVNNPLQEPMLHQDFPTKELHLGEYIKQIERGYDWKKQGHEYNYIDRLVNYPITEVSSRPDGYFKVSRKPFTESIDQIKIIRDKICQRIKRGGDCLVSNRDQAVTWVVERDLFVEEDQPCFDSETEILTKNGWKFFKDVKDIDLIATLNKDGFIEYHCPTKKIEYMYKGKMYIFEGVGINFKVTPNHNMYVCGDITEWPDSRSDGCLHIIIYDRDLCRYVSQFGLAHDKFIPDFVKELSSRQIKVFLDAKSLGDSRESGSTIRYTTTSRHMADDLQELILKAGRGGGDIWKQQGKEYYEVMERRFEIGKSGFKKDIQISECGETVYCVEVPNNIIFVRRYGRSMWCGNCFQRAQFFVYSFPEIRGGTIIPGKGEFHVSWRSRDLYAAWNSNMIALTLFFKKEVFEPNNINIIRCVDFCSSLHIYEGDWEVAEKVKPPSVNLYVSKLTYEE